MIGKIITPFLLCLICLLFASGIYAQQGSSANELAGTYVTGHRYGGNSLTLKADGSYSKGSGDCTATTEQSGGFLFSEGTVRGKTKAARDTRTQVRL